jgi:hypothetical protein
MNDFSELSSCWNSPSISKQYDDLNNQKSAILEKIKFLQDNCPHSSITAKADGNSGNWDGDNSYWIDWYCEDCRKSDRVYSTQQEYRGLLKYV